MRTSPAQHLRIGFSLLLISSSLSANGQLHGLRSVPFKNEIHQSFTTADGLPSQHATAIAVTTNGLVFTGTNQGLFQLVEDRWQAIAGLTSPIDALAADNASVLIVSAGQLYRWKEGAITSLGTVPASEVISLAVGNRLLLGTTQGLYEGAGSWQPVRELIDLIGTPPVIRQVAAAPDGRVAVAAAEGLLLLDEGWQVLHPRDRAHSWAVHDVRGVAFDSRHRLWFASPQGVGCLDGETWTLWTGHDGLPYNDFTTIAATNDGSVWLGTKLGAIRFDGNSWSYRQGRRWLASDQVVSIAPAPNGDTWFATQAGVSRHLSQVMTLSQKAKHFEEEIDKYHRRTPYGYVLEVTLDRPGDKSSYQQHDSDNDGLWTAMYGAGECFAYAATKDPKAKERAKAAFEALKFLSDVTQGGSHPAPRGFPARSILPTSGRNPNAVEYTPENDRAHQKEDPLWKVISPRWPTSADGKWYWKCDTSSDELDGHFFAYAAYYDLVADTDEEKQRVREVVTAIVDHLIEHDFDLVDHDGQPTRWARFGPTSLNHDPIEFGRGLNSLSILSYLRVAYHMTGEAKYQHAYDHLVKDHAYATNVLEAKRQNGPGSGNQSDDEMAMMCFYNLLKYESDARLRGLYLFALQFYWTLMEPELNPFFNYIYAASMANETNVVRLVPASCLAESLDTLQRFPLDRIRWGYQNSHRLDVVALSSKLWDYHHRTGHRRDGRVLPIDERFVQHWNHHVWCLDEGGDGREMADGAAFLLPYYMGLHHGFVIE